MLEKYSGPLPSLGKLIQCTRHTLERLEFSNLFASHPYYPSPGKNLLEKLWGYEPGSERDPITFPRLKTFILSSLILYTPSLITFLQAQPALEKATFSYIFLPTSGYSWADVAAALPPTCTVFHTRSCGGQASRGLHLDPAHHPNISYNQIEPFKPFQHAFPASTGWRASEAYLERLVQKQMTHSYYTSARECIASNIAAAQSGSASYQGPSLSELLKQSVELDRRIAADMQKAREARQLYDHADFERIET
jgi:hypothetical protein